MASAAFHADSAKLSHFATVSLASSAAHAISASRFFSSCSDIARDCLGVSGGIRSAIATALPIVGHHLDQAARDDRNADGYHA